MYTETMNRLSDAARNKIDFLNRSFGKYFISSLWAGAFVGLGIFLIMVIGGIGMVSGSAYTKMLMGVSFGVALSLVIMSGTELFTGNTMVMTVGTLDKSTNWKQTFKVWGSSYVGNFAGALVVALLILGTQINGSASGDFIVNLSEAKMNQSFWTLFFKGVLCNILVCLAVLSNYRLKSESARFIMVFWCLFAFITSGFEHSVANMTVFLMGLMLDHPDSVSLIGMANNLIPVTLGNIAGGSIFMGASIYYMGKEA